MSRYLIVIYVSGVNLLLMTESSMVRPELIKKGNGFSFH